MSEHLFDLFRLELLADLAPEYLEITDAALTKSQFYYNGVLVKHPNETTWEFSFQGCSIKVCNVSMQALKEIFHAD